MSEKTEQTTGQAGHAGLPAARIEPAKRAAGAEEGAAQDSGQKEPARAGSGLWAFIKAIFVRSPDEQRPDEVRAGNLPKGQGGHRGLPEGGGRGALFSAMDAPLHGLTPDDISYAGEVDAALARRPRFGVRALSLSVALLLCSLIVWASFANVDEVTHAEGQVVGSQRTQTIQNLEGGILRGIQVREGQIVEKGTVLAQLDNEMAESSFRDALSKAIENRLALIRLEAELKGEEPQFPADLRAFLSRRLGRAVDNMTLTRAGQILRDQQFAHRSRQNLLGADMEVLRAQYEQRKRDVEEQEAHKKQLEQSLEIARAQVGTASELMRRNNFARMEFLNLQQKEVELRGQVEMLGASIPKAKAAAEEARQRIASREAEERSQISQEISKRRLELNSLRETISAGGDRVTRTELRAPVRGTVRSIYINTVGGVVKPGEPIMDIVPLDDTLLVEARVSPKDVAFLRPGQDVMVKVSAYDFSIYGGLEGKLESISADTIEDKRGDFHYLVKVRTQKTAITHNNEILPIIPGMMVTADILIGKKTVLDYLLKPILKAKQNALRER